VLKNRFEEPIRKALAVLLLPTTSTTDIINPQDPLQSLTPVDDGPVEKTTAEAVSEVGGYSHARIEKIKIGSSM